MKTKKVLVVDPSEKRRRRLASFLRELAYELTEVQDIKQAADKLLGVNNFSFLIFNCSQLDSYQVGLLRSIHSFNPRLSIILLTPQDEPYLGVELINKGLIHHLGEPENLSGLYAVLNNEQEKQELRYKNDLYLKELRKLKREQERYLKKADILEEIYDTTIENLMTALDLRDVETFGHSRTVAKYSQVLARILGIEEKEKLDNIRKGALLHDVGKIAIPDSILKKAGSLTEEEWEKIRLHPSLGFGLIKEIKLVPEVGNIILYHHERYDGTGYPQQLKGEHIPLEARIFALADALDAITSYRPYRKERDFQVAREEIIKNKATQFDPEVVDAFCSIEISKWEKIRFETTRFLPQYEPWIKSAKSR